MAIVNENKLGIIYQEVSEGAPSWLSAPSSKKLDFHMNASEFRDPEALQYAEIQ